MERISVQCTINFTASQPNWKDWLLLQEVAGISDPGRAARILLQERLQLVKAGWKIDDKATLARLATVSALKPEQLHKLDDALRKIITESGGKNFRKGVGA